MSRPYLKPFTVAHFLKDNSGCGLAAKDETHLRNTGFFLDTCLRQLAVMPPRTSARPACNNESVEWFHDRDAYNFLLQTATGLNSAIPGESNILGQFKHGWEQWRDNAAPNDRIELTPLMQQLFTDSAQIRQQHLQGIGGHSYGSLLRKMLSPGADARILIVGAGELAQSLIPYLRNFDIAVWNRSSLRSQASDLRIFLPQHAASAADWATHMVITTPAEAANDRRWHQLTARGQQDIVHLGCRRERRGIWSMLTPENRFADLDDLFDLRQRQSTVRLMRVGYARKACQWRAARLSFDAGETLLPELVAQRA